MIRNLIFAYIGVSDSFRTDEVELLCHYVRIASQLKIFCYIVGVNMIRAFNDVYSYDNSILQCHSLIFKILFALVVYMAFINLQAFRFFRMNTSPVPVGNFLHELFTPSQKVICAKTRKDFIKRCLKGSPSSSNFVLLIIN